MFTCKEYRKVETLEEAWQLNQKKSNLLIGGMLWVKMGQRNVQTVIDLSGLGLDQIEETEEEFRIGCMVTLRQLEEHEGLNCYTDGAVRESVRHIVGVQFRNVATVGGSVSEDSDSPMYLPCSLPWTVMWSFIKVERSPWQNL